MQENTDKVKNLRNYYDKLANILKREASFKIFGKAIFDKKRIDDAMCCIDANFPYELKTFRAKAGNVNSSVKTFKLYKQLTDSIKNKPPMGSSSYLVKVEEALSIIDRLKQAVVYDINYIREHFSEIL